ncbi:MAG TPA: hypothetical protein VFH30_15080 [Acidimicrobiales bacterium]|jgi:hypothetical protein|nr:hypothetical protein [Acidimicrobiales bacterium]
MTTCQLVYVEDMPERVLLDMLPLDPLPIDGAVVPGGTPVTLSFQPSGDLGDHIQMVELLDRWRSDDGVIDLSVVDVSDVGGLRYIFTRDDEQLVLDVAA